MNYKNKTMKLNLEIELDWIDEESNLDETIKKQIINEVVNKIQNSVKIQIEKKIDKIIVMKINKLIEKIFKDFLNRELTINDNYGDVVKYYKNVRQFIKERFDNFMTQTVDEKGNTYDGSYGNKIGRLEFIIDKQLRKFADEFTTNAVKTVSAEIKTHVQEGLTNKLGSELIKVLKIDKMLELNK